MTQNRMTKTMDLKFTKMQGLGNDFVVVDGYTSPVNLTTEQIRRIADRRFGVGCDQLLLVERPTQSMADFRYRILMRMAARLSSVAMVRAVLLDLF